MQLVVGVIFATGLWPCGDTSVRAIKKLCDWQLDSRLFKHIIKHVECFTADAAGDEQLAGRLLASSALFPRLRLVIKDRAHGSRRLTSRGWGADEYIDGVLKTIVTGKGSIVRSIDASLVFTQWFAGFNFNIALNTCVGSSLSLMFLIEFGFRLPFISSRK